MCLSMVCPTCHIYLGQMLEKGEGFGIRKFPEGLVLSRNCPNLLRKIIYISMAHIIHDREIWGICKGYVEGWYTGLCPRYGDLFH